MAESLPANFAKKEFDPSPQLFFRDLAITLAALQLPPQLLLDLVDFCLAKLPVPRGEHVKGFLFDRFVGHIALGKGSSRNRQPRG
jgi:hypothetical protein